MLIGIKTSLSPCLFEQGLRLEMGRGDAGPSARGPANKLLHAEFELFFPPHNTQCWHVRYPANQRGDGSWDLAGYIIGFKGEMRKGILERTGAHLEVKGGGPDSPDPRHLSPDDKQLRIVIRAPSLKAVQKAADECARLLKPDNYDFKGIVVRNGGQTRLVPVKKPGGASACNGRASSVPSTGSGCRTRAPTVTMPNPWGCNNPAHPHPSHTAAADRDAHTSQAPLSACSPPGAQQASAPGPPTPAAAWKTQAASGQNPKLPSPRTPHVSAGCPWLEKLTLDSTSYPPIKRADPPGPEPRNSLPSTPPAWSPWPTAAAAPGPHCSKAAAGGSSSSSPQGPGTPDQGSAAVRATAEPRSSRDRKGGSTSGNKGGGVAATTKSEVPDAPGVPRAPALCKVLGLRNDIFLAQRGELVRKALDEASLGLHWHVAYTLIHSAANPSCENASFLEARDPVELFVVDSPAHEIASLQTVKHDVTQVSSAEKAVRSGKIRDLMQWLYGYRYATCVWTRDLRTLLQHVKNANRRAYYQGSAWEYADRLLELMTASLHRNAIAVPAHDGAALPSPEEVERLYGGNDAINARDARCIEETFEALQGLAKSIKLKGSLDQLPDGSDYRDVCEEIAGAAEKHLNGATRIYERYKILHGDTDRTQDHTPDSSSQRDLQTSLWMLESALRPAQPQQHPRSATGRNGSSCSTEIDGEKAKKKKKESASPEVQFALLSLWSRYGTHGEKERKPPADEGYQTVSSGKYSEDRTQHLRAATVQKFLLKNINKERGISCLYVEENEGIRLRILNPDVNSFKTDPFGITNQDVALRALDLAVRGIRRALIACSRVHGSSTSGGSPGGQGSDADSEIRRSNRRTLLKEVRSVGREQGMTGSCAPLKLASSPGGGRRSGAVKSADAAVIYKPAACSSGSETLMHDFATRHNLKRNSDWNKRQTEAFLTFDPHWGDPRFLSEFLLRLNESHGNIFPGFGKKLTQLKELRDKVAHQVHTINGFHISELKTDTVRQSIQDMIDLVMGLQALTDGTPQNGAEELDALQQLSSAFNDYQCWHNRQHGALRIKAADMLPRAYATVKGLLAFLGDPQSHLAHHQDDSITALDCQELKIALDAEELSDLRERKNEKIKALSDLLNIYTRIAHPNQPLSASVR